MAMKDGFFAHSDRHAVAQRVVLPATWAACAVRETAMAADADLLNLLI
jgi:hypothetical protein